MDIIVNREHILPILNRVVTVVERRQTLPILGNLLLKSDAGLLTIVGTDMEIEIKSRCKSDEKDSGEGTVPARKFCDICRSFTDGTDIRIKFSNDRCVITAGRGRYVLGTLPAPDFPSMEVFNPDVEIHIEEGILKKILDKTAFAMAQQDVRYYLNGLYFVADKTNVKAVATDGHRLASYFNPCNMDTDNISSVIIPFKTVNEIRRQVGNSDNDVKIEISNRIIRFTSGDTVSTSKVVDGRYPDYQRVIPATLNKVAIANRDDLRKSIARVAILSNEKYRGLRLTFETGILRLIAQNPEHEEAIEEMELNYEGEPTIIGFNVAYLTDLLNAIDTNEVEIHFEDGNSSSLWRGVGVQNETYIVMPMRI